MIFACSCSNLQLGVGVVIEAGPAGGTKISSAPSPVAEITKT
jgi:hypothetical protein